MPDMVDELPAGIDLSGEISTGDGVLLPFGLVGAFVVAYCD